MRPVGGGRDLDHMDLEAFIEEMPAIAAIYWGSYACSRRMNSRTVGAGLTPREKRRRFRALNSKWSFLKSVQVYLVNLMRRSNGTSEVIRRFVADAISAGFRRICDTRYLSRSLTLYV